MHECNALIDKLEQLNAFGVVLGTTQKRHEFIPNPDKWTSGNPCLLCGKEMTKHV